MKKVVIMDEEEYQEMRDKIARYENPQPTEELTDKQVALRAIALFVILTFVFFHQDIIEFFL